MVPKTNREKIATFVAKYSNAGSGLGYQGAIQAFLRCMFNLPKSEKVQVGTQVKTITCEYDYEKFFDMYLEDKKRKHVDDINTFAKFLLENSVSKQSARQRLTYAVKVLRAYGIAINKDDVCDLKRECKGGAGTIDRVMDHNVLCRSLNGASAQMRAIILIACSSGMRIGEILTIEKNEIEMNLNPVTIHIPGTKAKNGKYRFSFISKEAKDALVEYMKVRESPDFLTSAEKRVQNLKAKKEKTDDDAPVKIDNTKDTFLFPTTYQTVNDKWITLLKHSNQFSSDSTTGRNQYRIHGFRKFFISQMSMAGQKVLAELLAGHEGYLEGSYMRVSPEQAGREYLKVQSVLTVCIPESVKEAQRVNDERIGFLSEKTEEQKESINEVRYINQQLQQQITQTQQETGAQIAAMREQMGILTDTINTIVETMVSPEARAALAKDAAEGAIIAETLLKQAPGKRTTKKQ